MANLQVRNVPDDLHDELRRRAEEEGMSLTAFVLRELRLLVGRPDRSDFWREFEGRDDGVELTFDEIVEVIHEGRAERDRP